LKLVNSFRFTGVFTRISGQDTSAVHKQRHINADSEKLDADQNTDQVASSGRSWLNPHQKDATEGEIQELTGNPNVDAYDPTIAGKAIREGTTYNQAVMSTNLVNRLLGIPERFEAVREMPWESTAVNGRVDELMRDENLSFDAAVVVAMTERPKSTSNLFTSISQDWAADMRGEAPVEGAWEDSFAQMVTDSSVEIAAWAESQPAGSTASFGDGADEIKVFLRDGMVVVSSDGGKTEQVFDPAEHDRIVISAGGGDDKITVDPAVTENLMIVGGDGNDTVFGGNGSNIIIGGEGNDNLEGGSSNDLIIGGAGRDSVYGGGGADTIAGWHCKRYFYGAQCCRRWFYTWSGYERDCFIQPTLQFKLQCNTQGADCCALS